MIPLLLDNPDHPASIHSRDNNGNTPLHHASASGSLKALRLLLEAGANPQARNSYDWTPLAYSQTVAAEVYFKNLIAEFGRRNQESYSPSMPDDIGTPGSRTRKAGGVRLVTSNEEGLGLQQVSSNIEGGVGDWDSWSPVARGDGTPTLANAMGQFGGFGGPRTRARTDSGGSPKNLS